MDDNKYIEKLKNMDEFLKFLYTKVFTKLVRKSELLFKENEKNVFTMSIESCFVFNMDMIAVTITDSSGLSLIPILLDIKDIDGTLKVIKNIISSTVKEILNIDADQMDDFSIDVLWYERIIYEYNSDTKKITRDLRNYIESKKVENALYNDNDDDDEYYV